MPAKIDIQPYGVQCTYSGPCGLRDVLEAMHVFMQHERYENFKYAIHDCTKVESITPDETELISVVAQAIGAAYTNKKIKSSIVLNNEAGRALLKKYMGLTKRTVIEFATLDEAKAWATTL
jgi:tRNA pseudouridine-54 N-methylase